MRRSRLIYLLITLYFTFIGGGTYYATIFPVRVAHHLIVTVLMSLWLIGRIRNKQGFPLTSVNLPIYATVLVWFVSAIFAVDPRMSLENSWFLLTHVLLFFIIVSLIQRGYQRNVMEILFFMAAIVLLLSGVELASWFFGLGITPGTSFGWIETGRIPTLAQIPRLSLALGISTLQAGYTAPLVIVTAGWALTTQRRDYRIVLMLMSIALLVALVLTSSRGGLLSLIAAIGTLSIIRLLQYPPLLNKIPRPVLLTGGGLLGATVLVGFVLLSLPFGKGNSDSGRMDMYRSAVRIASDNPLTGVGVGMYGREFRTYRNPAIAQDKLASAHNLYLNTSAELGIPGISVGLWLLGASGFAVWHNWRNTPNRGHRKRIEIVVAALAGLAVHSMVDVFAITPLVLLTLTLAAYAITPHPHSRIEKPPQGKVVPVIIMLLLVIAYGLAFIPIDRANALYFESWDTTTIETALEKIKQAQNLDPYLTLYDLHEAYIIGQSNPVSAGIEAYKTALELEPTWTTGLINLALLEEQDGNPESALNYLEKASAINGHIAEVWFNWARIAETYNLAPENTIIEAYEKAIQLQYLTWLPLSEYWAATRLRREAVDLFLQEQSIEIQYRVYATHDETRLNTLLPDTPQSAAEWWVVGEYNLAQGNMDMAYGAFSQAIELAPHHGDYYVARARAAITLDPIQVEHDAVMGSILGTQYEYPNVVRAKLVDDETAIRNLLAVALPLRFNRPEFAAVLYGRPSVFDISPAGTPPGYGGETIQAWLEVAFSYLESGDETRARTAFTFILSQAPYNSIAWEQLDLLNSSQGL